MLLVGLTFAANQLPTSMTVSTTLEAGDYHTTALTTTAGITLTFDGQGVDDHWLINSAGCLYFLYFANWNIPEANNQEIAQKVVIILQEGLDKIKSDIANGRYQTGEG